MPVASGSRFVDTIWHDLRYAVRTLSKNWGLTALAITSLGIGLGANTALFSLVDALLLRSLPVTHPARLVLVQRTAANGKAVPIEAGSLDVIRGLTTIYSDAALSTALPAATVTIDSASSSLAASPSSSVISKLSTACFPARASTRWSAADVRRWCRCFEARSVIPPTLRPRCSILGTLGFNPLPFLAGAGLLGLVIGFGAQSLINDVVSGFFIPFENIYLVGDVIEEAARRRRRGHRVPNHAHSGYGWATAYRSQRRHETSGQLLEGLRGRRRPRGRQLRSGHARGVRDSESGRSAAAG